MRGGFPSRRLSAACPIADEPEGTKGKPPAKGSAPDGADRLAVARGKAQRPARYEHTRGDIPGYGSFSNYIDQAWRLNIDINKPAGKASRKR